MSWFWLALLSAASTSVVGIVDKIVVERVLRDRWSFPFFISLFLGLYAVGLLIVRGALGLFRIPPAPALAIALLPGILQYLASVLYTRALRRTDAATVAAITQTAPLFSVLWGWLAFGEVFRPLGYVGIVLSVACCAGLSMERGPHRRRALLNPLLAITVGSAALRSLGDLFVKVTLGGEDYWNTFGLSRAALVPITLLLLAHAPHRRLVGRSLRARGVALLGGMAALELLAIVPLVLSTMAYGRGPLALVSAVRYISPLFVLALTGLLNRLHAGLVPDREGAGPFPRRAALTVGILAGVVLLRV
ncbi:MAG TPA: DMT family transporter [bacterium]|nr:DMT family transporter [bacterium]